MAFALSKFGRRVEYRYSSASATVPDFQKQAERNRARNRRKNWPRAQLVAHAGTGILVGSGPSLNVEEVRSCNGDVFAVGKTAAARLNAAGIVPDYLIVSSPEPATALPPAKKYLLADHCDPALFDKTRDVRVFSASVAPAGATSVVLAPAIGYSNLHLHGFDSSYAGGPIEVQCAGRKFKSSVWLASQVDSILQSSASLLNQLGSITVHGDGLLQAALASVQMDDDGPCDVAELDFSNNPISFDFVTWMAAAELCRQRAGCDGPLRVRFYGFDKAPADDKMGAAGRQRMLDNVVRPTLELFGGIEDPTASSHRLHHFSYKTFTDAFRAGERIPKIYVPATKITASGTPQNRITITLREAHYSAERNSDIEAWTAFAKRRQAEGYNVVFVRDTAKADAPLADFETVPQASRDLFSRIALYNSSLCNLSRDNGPIGLLFFSDIPFVVLIPLNQTISDGWHGPQHKDWWARTAGFTPPEQFPWLGKLQRVEWVKDTAENIEAGWQRWLAVRNG